MVETRTSKHCNSFYDAEKDEFFMRCFETTSKYNHFKWERVSKVELPPITIAEYNHLSKELTLNVVFLRSVTDQESLKTLKGLFTKKATFKVTPKHTYLSLSQKRDFVMLHDLAKGTTQTASFQEASGKKLSGLNALFSVTYSDERRLKDNSEALEVLKQPDSINRVYVEEQSTGELSLTVFFARL